MADIFVSLWDLSKNHFWALLSMWIYNLKTQEKPLLLVVKNYYRLSLEVEYYSSVTITNLEALTFPYSVLARKYETRWNCVYKLHAMYHFEINA